MSRVFVAEETALGRKVVVKVLPPDLAATVNVERFRREIQLAAQLQHPLIVPVLSAGISDGLPYYTMPLVAGESLRQKISKSGELPINEVVRIMRDMLSALSYAHEQGVVHRDIKPDNVLLTKHHAVVTDFGVAKALSASTNPGSSLTSLGVALGTPAYMAPEQAAADPNTDHRADIYAVGATAYEMLTGKQLFSGRSPQAMLAAQAIETPEPVEKWRPTAPPALSALVMRALEKHAADRPQSAEEMLNVLQGLITPSGGTTPTMTVPLPASKPKKSLIPMLAGVAGLAIVAVAAFAYVKNRTPAAPPLDDARVMVAPFQNKTGDPSLDPIAGMATDWVTRGLTETGLVDIAPYAPKRNEKGVILAEAYDMNVVAKEARSAAASKIITGAYYKQGDSVQFQAQIIDAADGRSLGTVTPSTSALSSPLTAITAMRARVANALGELTRSDRGGFSTQDVPPSFDAYKEFLQGEDAFNTRDFAASYRHYTKAAKLDTNYVAPVVRAVYVLMNMRRFAEADSLAATLEPKRVTMSAYELNYLDRGIALVRGDQFAAYTSAKKLLAVAPKSTFAAYIAARSALPINRPAEALAGLEKLDLRVRHTSGYYADFAAALHMLGQHDRELEVAKLYRENNSGLTDPLLISARALGAMGRMNELRQVINMAMAMPRTQGVSALEVYNAAVRELNAHGFAPEAKSIASELLSYAETLPPVRDSVVLSPLPPSVAGRGTALMILGRYREVQALHDSLAPARGNTPGVIALDGELAALMGDTARAEADFRKLAAMQRPYDRGESIVGQAQIAARLGRKAQAVQLLRIAISRGLQYNAIHTNLALVTLKGFPEYEELLKPEG